MNKIINLLLLLLVTGCAAVPVKEQFSQLNKKSICCATLKEFKFVPIKLGKVFPFELSHESPAYLFGKTKSYYKAFSLPDMRDKYVFVKSYFNGGLIRQYLDPVFFSLDENHKPLEAFSLNLRFTRGTFLIGDSNARMSGVAKLNPNSKYLVIFSGGYELEKPVIDLGPSTMVTMIGNVPYATTEPGSTIELERSPTGSLKIELKLLQDNK